MARKRWNAGPAKKGPKRTNAGLAPAKARYVAWVRSNFGGVDPGVYPFFAKMRGYDTGMTALLQWTKDMHAKGDTPPFGAAGYVTRSSTSSNVPKPVVKVEPAKKAYRQWVKANFGNQDPHVFPAYEQIFREGGRFHDLYGVAKMRLAQRERAHAASKKFVVMKAAPKPPAVANKTARQAYDAWVKNQFTKDPQVFGAFEAIFLRGGKYDDLHRFAVEKLQKQNAASWAIPSYHAPAQGKDGARYLQWWSANGFKKDPMVFSEWWMTVNDKGLMTYADLVQHARIKSGL